MAFVKATPYARKIAKQYHIDLSAVTPSGPGGAVLARDVEKAREGYKRTREVPVTPLAQRIAESMHVEVDVTAMEDLRLHHNENAKIRYSVNDLILMAAAKALRKHRQILCSYAEDSIIYKPDVNLGMAVAMEDGAGLLVPVIREADTLSADELASKAHDLARRTRDKKISPDECSGSTFTVTNLGMYGVEAFTPLLNLPNAAILGVCSIYDGVAVKNGAVEVRKLLHLCLTFDHRALDGAVAAKFNLTMKEYLENPSILITGFS